MSLVLQYMVYFGIAVAYHTSARSVLYGQISHLQENLKELEPSSGQVELCVPIFLDKPSKLVS